MAWLAGGWEQPSLGVICNGTKFVETLIGAGYVYGVQFDEPQEDITGTVKHRKAQILSCHL